MGVRRRHDQHRAEPEQGVLHAGRLHGDPDGDRTGRIEHGHEGQPDQRVERADRGHGHDQRDASDRVRHLRSHHHSIVGASATGNYTSDRRALKWSDGSPVPSGTSADGVTVGGGTGKGFQIVVPADTTKRTLVLYVGTGNATGKLTARLSDGSAPAYVSSAGTRITKSWEGYYTLTYWAASAGQTLTVQWTVDSAKRPASSATARLQGAALK